jgi:hypothetical protein
VPIHFTHFHFRFILKSELLKPTSPALVSFPGQEGVSPEAASQVTEYFPDVIFVHNRFAQNAENCLVYFPALFRPPISLFSIPFQIAVERFHRIEAPGPEARLLGRLLQVP